MPELHPLIQLALVVLGPTGAAWVGVRASLNGTRRAVAETRQDVKEIRAVLGQHGDRLTRIETRMEDR